MRHLAGYVFTFFFCHTLLAQPPKELRTIIEVAGTDSGSLLGYFVKGVGDLNKDGYADVAVCAPWRFRTYLYYGGKNMSKTPGLIFEGGGKVVTGDFNGDGWTDLAIGKWFKDTVLVYYGGPAMDTIPDVVLAMNSDYFGLEIAAGDLNGDGYADLAIATWDQNYSDSLYAKGRIFVYAGGISMDQTPVAVLVGDTLRAGLGYDLAIGDVNSDGKKDIVSLGYNQASANGALNFYYISVYLGNVGFSLKRDYYIDARKVTWGFANHVKSFDVDGDGVDDILTDGVLIFKGGSIISTSPTYIVYPPNKDTTSWGRYPRIGGGGDFNGDGKKDLLMGPTGFASTLLMYLGGKGLNQSYVAYKSGGFLDGFTDDFDDAGDVNGDGINDIIVGASGYFNGDGQGFFGIYSGDTSLVVSVEEEPIGKPPSFELRQNYPNPFNPSTTIDYSILRKTFVKIRIFDTSGKEVASLVNQEQGRGNYSVVWRGQNTSGAIVPSGVYYYQLITSDQRQAKKLIHLK